MKTRAASQKMPEWWQRDWFWGLLLALAVFVAYTPMWSAGFIGDDWPLIVSNPSVITPLGLKEIWTTSAADICPLTLTTFWLIHALFGPAPLAYHLVNVLWHAAAAVVLWRVLRRLAIPGAWLGAALWALHPVQVESVAWVSEMKNTQSGFFYLLSVLFFLRWMKARNAKDTWTYGLTILFAALAMASKSSTVILPVVLCLVAWWMNRRWERAVLMKIAPIFLLSLIVGLVSIWTQNAHGAGNVYWTQSATPGWPQRLATAGAAVWFYLGKLIWPHPLLPIYENGPPTLGFAYLPLLGVIVVLLALAWKRDTWARPYFFCFAYFLVALLPVLGLINMSFARYSSVADHFQYLASMGPLALLGAGLASLSTALIPKNIWAQALPATALVLMLGFLSCQRACVYQSDETLWTDALASDPSYWVGYNNLGIMLAHEGKLDEAIADFQKVLELNPNEYETLNNYGLALSQKGETDEAIDLFQKAVKINPAYANPYLNMGNIYFSEQHVDEAVGQYKKALEVDPKYVEAHRNLGVALFQTGHVDEAISHYQEALALNPYYADAHLSLGIALFKKGEANEAIAQFQETLQLNPDDENARADLAKVQAMMQQSSGSQ